MSQGKITNFSNINPRSLERNFDNEAWEESLQTSMKFIRVLWSSDYTDIVDWTSEQMRDDYFDRTHPDEIVLKDTGFNFKDLMKWNDGEGKYKGYIRINLPAESINRHNYLAVTHKYTQPVPGPSERETKYFFFVKSINPLSPNTTEVYLQLDVWTTYKFLVEITGLYLERGHYPLANTNATSFLSNPLNTPIDITADEPDLPRIKPLTSSVSLASLQNAEPRVCFTTTFNFNDIEEAFYPSRSTTPPDDWWEGSTNGYSGSVAVVPASRPYVHGNAPGLRVFSIAPENFNDFINTLRRKYPQLVKTIKAIYVLSTDFIEENTAFTCVGYNLKPVVPQTSLKKFHELVLSKDKWGYETKYSDYAKLYTGQFSEIVISDLANFSKTIAVEELAGNLEFYGRANTVFPFLKIEAFINGIGGKTYENITIKPWNNLTSRIYDSKWSDYRFEIDVPTYSIYLDAREEVGTAFNKEKWTLDDNRKKTLASSKNVNSVTRTNESLSINTIRSNESISNNNIKDTGLITALNSKNISIQDISNRYDINAEIIDVNYTMAEIQGLHAEKLKDLNVFNAAVEHDLGISSSLIAMGTSVSSVAASGISGVLSGGGVGSAVGTVLNIGVNAISSIAQMDLAEDVTEYRMKQIIAQYSLNDAWDDMIAIDYEHAGNKSTIYFKYQEYSLFRKIADHVWFNDLRMKQWEKTADEYVVDENYDNSIIPFNNNFTANESISIANQSTSDTISINNKNLNDDIADNTSAISINNLENLRAQKISGTPTEYGANSGPGYRDQWGERGFTVTINRVSKAAENIIGEAFRTSGYRVNNLLIQSPTLTQMSDFTYWKASRIWTKAGALNDSNEIIIKNCFLNGCTIWKNPDNVKNISLPNTPQGVL